MAADNEARQTSMSIDLGGEQVVLERIECMELLGRPFTLTVDIISSLGEIDLLPHLGKPVALKVFEDGVFLRDFHGLITEGEFVSETSNGYHYQLVARPFTHFLAQNRDMAIFQDLSALDIIKKVFTNAGASDVDYAKVSRSYSPRTYCVQYQESDFAFITRLMEEEGLYYYWRHESDRHVLVLCDAPSSHPQGKPASLTWNPEASTVALSGSAERASFGTKSFVNRWHERVTTTGQARVTLRDYDLVKPERPLQAVSSDKQVHPSDAREVYHYPGGFTDESAGTKLGRSRLDAMRHDRQTYSGECQASGLACGTKVSVEGHPVGRLNAGYLIVSAYHSILSETYRSGGGAGSDQPFNVRFDAIPAATAFALPRETPKPVVDGLESAVVSGPDGEEIFTDEYGRVKIRFHWDRGETPGEKSTCWVRVAQFGGLGNIVLPRVGQEVMVDFLHGDPDRPVVMGWVFNNVLKPVYQLPAHKTRAVWRTKRYGDTGSYPNAKALDTGTPGANELRFEDKGGSEEVFLHAERDMNTRIRFEETHHVGATQHIMVGYDRTDDVGRDETTEIGRNQILTVGGNQTEHVKAKREIKVDATDKLTVGQSITVSAGTTIEMTANTSITLKCGPSSIKIDPSGITIQGPMVKADASGAATVQGMMTDIKGATGVTVSGAIVKIN